MPWSIVIMVIAIVAITQIARLIKDRREYERASAAPVETQDAARLREDVQKLRERVQVLERVITDDRKSIDLDREIARLRDN